MTEEQGTTTDAVNSASQAVDDLTLTSGQPTKPEILFNPEQKEDTDNVMVIESLCVACEEQGETRMLLTHIPHFREVVISSFSCPHCQYRNNDIMPSATIQETGVFYKLNVKGPEDLNRQVIRQASASFKIVELDFEAPGFTVKGSLTTIEGLFQAAVDGLEQNQVIRRIMEPEIAEKIDEIIRKLRAYQTGATPFTLEIRDPSGNSFVENRHAPAKDPEMKLLHFKRSQEENEKMGLALPEEEQPQPELQELERRSDYFTEIDAPLDAKDEVLDFPTICANCQAPVMEHMKLCQIPNFKEVIIMSSHCDGCGQKSSQVKVGGGMEAQGTRITLRMTDPSDLTRDVLKSESCAVSIPELDIELKYSSSGKFTSLEGLLMDIQKDLGRINPFAYGDSAETGTTNKMDNIKTKLDQVMAGELMVTLMFDDPVGNSYMQNLYAPEQDPELTIEKYERTEEQNEEFGILDMKTEGYEQEDEASDVAS